MHTWKYITEEGFLGPNGVSLLIFLIGDCFFGLGIDEMPWDEKRLVSSFDDDKREDVRREWDWTGADSRERTTWLDAIDSLFIEVLCNSYCEICLSFVKAINPLSFENCDDLSVYTGFLLCCVGRSVFGIGETESCSKFESCS